MGFTTITLDTDTVMDLRAVKVEMSRDAGRSVPFAAVIRTLITDWREHHAAAGTGSPASHNREETRG